MTEMSFPHLRERLESYVCAVDSIKRNETIHELQKTLQQRGGKAICAGEFRHLHILVILRSVITLTSWLSCK